MEQKFFSPAEVAVRWNCSAKTITRYCQANVIRYMKLGKLYRIAVGDLEEFERANSIQVFDVSWIYTSSKAKYRQRHYADKK